MLTIQITIVLDASLFFERIAGTYSNNLPGKKWYNKHVPCSASTLDAIVVVALWRLNHQHARMKPCCTCTTVCGICTFTCHPSVVWHVPLILRLISDDILTNVLPVIGLICLGIDMPWDIWLTWTWMVWEWDTKSVCHIILNAQLWLTGVIGNDVHISECIQDIHYFWHKSTIQL